jgi:hypothetical protein
MQLLDPSVAKRNMLIKTRFLEQKQDSMQSIQLVLDNQMKLSMSSLSRNSSGVLKMIYSCEFIKK